MMGEGSQGAVAWLNRRANDVAVALMGIMFVSFLLQIAFRYLLNQPLGWTEEVTVLCWLWVVLWCAAFVLSDHDEIRFDIVYTVVPAEGPPALHGDLQRRHRRSLADFAACQLELRGVHEA